MLGVFAGEEKDLATEKKIFGKDFAYIRNITGFSKSLEDILQSNWRMMNKKAEYGGNAMFQNNKKAAFLDYLMIIVGTALMATAINSVFDMSGMVTGGFSGIAILVKEWTEGVVPGGIPLWITNLSLNIPLFLIGMKLSGFQFVKRALVGEICLSFWLAVLPAFDIAGNDLLLAAVYGGVIQGIGIGLVFLGRGTTGGTDMMAALLQRKLRHYSIAHDYVSFIDGALRTCRYVCVRCAESTLCHHRRLSCNKGI